MSLNGLTRYCLLGLSAAKAVCSQDDFLVSFAKQVQSNLNEPLKDHGNLFKIWVVQGTEG